MCLGDRGLRGMRDPSSRCTNWAWPQSGFRSGVLRLPLAPTCAPQVWKDGSHEWGVLAHHSFVSVSASLLSFLEDTGKALHFDFYSCGEGHPQFSPVAPYQKGWACHGLSCRPTSSSLDLWLARTVSCQGSCDIRGMWLEWIDCTCWVSCSSFPSTGEKQVLSLILRIYRCLLLTL